MDFIEIISLVNDRLMFLCGFLVGLVVGVLGTVFLPNLRFLLEHSDGPFSLKISKDKMDRLAFFQKILNTAFPGYAFFFDSFTLGQPKDFSANSTYLGCVKFNKVWTAAILDGDKEGTYFPYFVVSCIETAGHEVAHKTSDLSFLEVLGLLPFHQRLLWFRHVRLYNWVKEIHHDFYGFKACEIPITGDFEEIVDTVVDIKLRDPGYKPKYRSLSHPDWDLRKRMLHRKAFDKRTIVEISKELGYKDTGLIDKLAAHFGAIDL